uniref:Uncharacterized protein n=1 Tax=Siphoviridae sp. ctxjx4 TaxID=2826522 RepID=A0A8S5M235_9CAUD|nr:MAG TPA: hypothetical protein [Siphoviridae sp. ctxjx4]
MLLTLKQNNFKTIRGRMSKGIRPFVKGDVNG